MHQTIAVAILAGSLTAAVQAQPAAGYTGPSQDVRPATPAGYSGPSSVPLMSVQQLLNDGKDDQHARLQGRIVSHDGGDRYTFADASGRITAEIDDDVFPRGQTISAEQRVELWGEFDKGLRKTEFEVQRLTLLP